MGNQRKIKKSRFFRSNNKPKTRKDFDTHLSKVNELVPVYTSDISAPNKLFQGAYCRKLSSISQAERRRKFLHPYQKFRQPPASPRTRHQSHQKLLPTRSSNNRQKSATKNSTTSNNTTRRRKLTSSSYHRHPLPLPTLEIPSRRHTARNAESNLQHHPKKL